MNHDRLPAIMRGAGKSGSLRHKSQSFQREQLSDRIVARASIIFRGVSWGVVEVYWGVVIPIAFLPMKGLECF